MIVGLPLIGEIVKKQYLNHCETTNIFKATIAYNLGGGGGGKHDKHSTRDGVGSKNATMRKALNVYLK